jgi:hypothetical protein
MCLGGCAENVKHTEVAESGRAKGKQDGDVPEMTVLT